MNPSHLQLKISKRQSIHDTSPIVSRFQDYISNLSNSDYRYHLNGQEGLKVFKGSLPLYMLAGVFSGAKNTDIVKLSGLLPLDLDFKHEEESEHAISRLMAQVQQEAIDHDIKPICIHKTASGKGLRLIYYSSKVDRISYKPTLINLITRLETDFRVEFDRSTTNIARSWFIAYDPNAFISEELVEIPDRFLSRSIHGVDNGSTTQISHSECSFESTMDHYLSENCTDGNKHEAIRIAAIKASSFISEGVIELSLARRYLQDYIKRRSNVNDLQAAYKTIDNGFDYGLKNHDPTKRSNGIKNMVKGMKKVDYYGQPGVYDEIKHLLPKQMQAFIDQHNHKHIRDFVLVGLITFTSSILHNICFTYNGKKQYCNLFSLIISPAGSGKNEVEKLTTMLSRIEARLADDNLFHNLGSNFSIAKLLEVLSKSEGKGLVFDTEADILSKNKENDWGDSSTTFRKMFANESERPLRKTDKEPIYIAKPRAGVLLTGTADQLTRFFEDVQNGLFSRFLILYYNPEVKFQLRPSSFEYDSTYLEMLSQRLETSYFETKECLYHLTEEQTELLNETFQSYMLYLRDQGFEESGLVTRGSLILTKIAVTLSVLEQLENTDTPNDKIISEQTQTITPDSFAAASILQQRLMTTSLNLAQHYQNKVEAVKIERSFPEDILTKLPETFTRGQALAKGKAHKDYSTRTIDRKLSEGLANKQITKIGHGTYSKTAPQS